MRKGGLSKFSKMRFLLLCIYYRPLSKLHNRFTQITRRWQKKARQVYEVCGTRDACQLLRRKLHESF